MARLLAATDVDFARTLAFECLWDCEETTREIGCRSVEMTLDGAKPRLEALAADPGEDEAVIEAAKDRLLG